MNRYYSLFFLCCLCGSPLWAERTISLSPLPPIPSDVGKPAFFEVLSGPPPRAKGAGLHFDTSRLFYVYSDQGAPANHFAPSGWMGDYDDIELDLGSHEDPADGKTCIKITYGARSHQGNGWAGMMWQDPGNNWGDKIGGFNLTGMKRVTFWARSQTDGVTIPVFKVGGTLGTLADSDSMQIGPVTLTREWQQFVIDLTHVDLSKISSGFSWAVGASDNAGPIVFYLDEIRYER